MSGSERSTDPSAQGPSSQGDDATAPSAAFPRLAGAGLDELLSELLGRVEGIVEDQRRLRLLLDAVVGVAADLSVDSVLSRIVRIASDLAGAQYAALGVLDTTGADRPWRALIQDGLSEERRELIGDLPSGHGLLGQIIDRPLRLHDLSQHPSSYGFPENHPIMRSFLGVPIRIRERVFGNLYLTEKVGGGDFTEPDEAVVVALAAAAGVVIENARLYEEASRRERWLVATAEVTARLSAGIGADDGLRAVADRAREMASADTVTLLIREGGNRPYLAAVSGIARPTREGAHPAWTEESLAAAVFESGETVVVEDARRDQRTAEAFTSADAPEIGSLVMVPLRTVDGVEGVLTLAWTPVRVSSFHAVDVAMVERFATQAALARQVSRARADREKLAVFEDRDRIARDLHDLVIQRLFAIGLGLENAVRGTTDESVRERVASGLDDIDETIKDIRRSIFALNVSTDSTDLRATVVDLVDRAAKLLGFRPNLRFEGPVDSYVTPELASDVLAVLGEALSNTARHARASHAWVQLSVGQGLVLTVRDDGCGTSPDAARSGLRNMQERAQRLGGTCTLGTREGGGTSVVWSVPRA